MLTSVSQDGLYVYYFASISSAFASVPSFETPLAAAFPNNPEHQGDGVYLLSKGSVSVAVIQDGEKFRLLVNNVDAVASAIADLDLPVYMAEQFTPVPMLSITERHRHLADAFSGKVIKWSTVVTVAALGLGLIANVASAAFTTSLKSTNDQYASELGLLVAKIEHSSPLSKQLAQIQKISATVVRAGGWINSYELAGDKEKFVVSLPDWVTQDFIAALGREAVADRDLTNNIIKVEKK
ncbi:hypothetical protein ACFQAT_25770 [Undibacterium arcticum]|uniref:hypothetical protein n=1 Tax=Undibacterium arcticum TaxID=1762892 RepID=UPI003610CC98